MPQPDNAPVYDIVIIGAGPAGCACALALKDAGLRVAILDKQNFPRDKVCGDAIPGRAIKTLRNIDPAYEASFRQFSKKFATKKTSLFYKGQAITFNWVGEAYTCARMDFDNFLFSLVKENTGTEIFTDTTPGTLIISNDHVTIPVKNSDRTITAKMIIGADGAQSAVAKQLTNRTVDRDHYVGSVRAYYENVADLNNDTTDIYFDKRFLPSYLWVFPLPGNMANVGFGMLSSEIAKRKINIKKAFYEFIEQTPELKLKFKDAVLYGDLEGFGLPLGSKIGVLSGARYMLTGDAASLIDPISGDGIGNAMLSGRLAALQAIQCFQQNNFTAPFMQGYDSALTGALGKELKARYRAQRILSKVPALLDVVFFAGKNKILKKVIQKGL
ncbi:MAG: geranylgeranyl reductase [Flavipsychrobacter sp.]|nr:geranylgeranyl reductase [Flavipsychrobacter sp.]